MVLSLIVLAVMGAVAPFAYAGRKAGEQPAPRLLSPTDLVDLTGKDKLIFTWGTEGDRSAITYYDFKIYKGHETFEAGLIRREKVAASDSSIAIESSLFENGGTYAWQMRSMGLRKSRSAYSIFKVKK